MKHILRFSSWLYLLLLAAGSAAQDSRAFSTFWTDVPELSLTVPERTQVPLPNKFRLLQLADPAALERRLLLAPAESVLPARNSAVLVEVPLPDGSFQQFRIVNAPVMHPDLARQYPEINSFFGVGVENSAARIYCSYSPLGFNAIILAPGSGHVLIEPVHASDTRHYLCYFLRDFEIPSFPGGCSTVDGERITDFATAPDASLAGDCRLRTYDLAIAATAEFTAAAGSAANVLANFNTLVTTINALFINEAAIRLRLVANNNAIIFTNTATDGYTDGANQNTLAGQSQGVIDGAITAAAYDIGHTVSTNPSGGWAGVSQQIGNVCTGNKASAATIFNPVPIPNGFAMAFWHEMGHQFGARHTFNDNTTGSCNPGQLDALASYEPGSGSTIMSYAGTCGVMDVIGNRDQYYHAISLQEIGNYVTSGAGSGCATVTPLANNAPVVNAPNVVIYNLPVSTPFVLTATSSDADGDALFFCWEQWNRELITNPPAATATQGPVFRSFPPTPSPTRYFPNLPSILSGTPQMWEVLPSVSRTMDFRVTARDDAAGGGCTDEDNIALEFFSSAGPFRVTAPAAAACFAAEGPMTVTWDVAGTNAGDVNCANVDILLSTDGGLTYPTTLLAGTPNDGSQSVTLPDVLTNTARVMVRGSGNIFFNISPGDFRIECISNLVVADNPASGTYEARQRVSTFGTVTVVGFAEFLAGTEVLLNVGFSALLGCDFLARIQPCVACSSPRPPMLALQEIEPEQPRIHLHYLQYAGQMRNEPANDQWFLVYPNPFDQQFTVRFDLVEAGKVSIELVDATGRLALQVYQEEYLEAGPYQIFIPAGQLPPGMYDCRIRTAGKQENRKVLKL